VWNDAAHFCPICKASCIFLGKAAINRSISSRLSSVVIIKFEKILNPTYAAGLAKIPIAAVPALSQFDIFAKI
jgi:hypothetical protein